MVTYVRGGRAYEAVFARNVGQSTQLHTANASRNHETRRERTTATRYPAARTPSRNTSSVTEKFQPHI